MTICGHLNVKTTAKAVADILGHLNDIIGHLNDKTTAKAVADILGTTEH
jgi:hypothetical protein